MILLKEISGKRVLNKYGMIKIVLRIPENLIKVCWKASAKTALKPLSVSVMAAAEILHTHQPVQYLKPRSVYIILRQSNIRQRDYKLIKIRFTNFGLLALFS